MRLLGKQTASVVTKPEAWCPRCKKVATFHAYDGRRKAYCVECSAAYERERYTRVGRKGPPPPKAKPVEVFPARMTPEDLAAWRERDRASEVDETTFSTFGPPSRLDGVVWHHALPAEVLR